MREIEIVPTIVPKGRDEILSCASKWHGVAPLIHVDVADGVFAGPISWLPDGGEKFTFPFEAHAMVLDSKEIGNDFAKLGARRIIAHAETLTDKETVLSTLNGWKSLGCEEVGLAITSTTNLSLVEPWISYIDFVHIMTIRSIGKQGLPFDESSPERIKEFHIRFPSLLISVDGGVSDTTIERLVKAGARRFSVGSYLSRAVDGTAAYRSILELGLSALQ